MDKWKKGDLVQYGEGDCPSIVVKFLEYGYTHLITQRPQFKGITVKHSLDITRQGEISLWAVSSFTKVKSIEILKNDKGEEYIHYG